MQTIGCSTSHDLHKIIKHALIGRRKTGFSEENGSLVFKFTLQYEKLAQGGPNSSVYLVELSSEGLLNSLQKSRVKKAQDIPWGLRVLEAAYESNLVKALCKLIPATSKSSFCFLFNDAQTDDQASETLLQLSQFINEGESSSLSTTAVVKEKVSSGIKLILSKKSAKKSDQKKTGDKTASRIEENPRKRELFR